MPDSSLLKIPPGNPKKTANHELPKLSAWDATPAYKLRCSKIETVGFALLAPSTKSLHRYGNDMGLSSEHFAYYHVV